MADSIVNMLDSDKPARPRSLIRVIIVYTDSIWILRNLYNEKRGILDSLNAHIDMKGCNIRIGHIFSLVAWPKSKHRRRSFS